MLEIIVVLFFSLHNYHGICRLYLSYLKLNNRKEINAYARWIFAMANTSMLVVGGVFVIGGILTIPVVIGLFCTPLGCLLMLIGLVMSNPTSSSVIISQQPQQNVGYVVVGYNQYGQPVYAPTTQMQTQYYSEK